MKPIKCTKAQFTEFKNTYAGKRKGKELYYKMMDHFKRTSPERYESMQASLNEFSNEDHKWLYGVLELSPWVYNKYAYMPKNSWGMYKTIDGQKYTYLSIEYADRWIHNINYQANITWPKSAYTSEILDYLNTYLCTYNM